MVIFILFLLFPSLSWSVSGTYMSGYQGSHKFQFGSKQIISFLLFFSLFIECTEPYVWIAICVLWIRYIFMYLCLFEVIELLVQVLFFLIYISSNQCSHKFQFGSKRNYHPFVFFYSIYWMLRTFCLYCNLCVMNRFHIWVVALFLSYRATGSVLFNIHVR